MDPQKQEFRDQVSLHREKIRKLFGIFPTSFRNTELMYNNNIADVVADMGYLSILCEKREDMFTQAERPISPNAVFRAEGQPNSLSSHGTGNSVTTSPSVSPISPIAAEQYAAVIAKIDGEAVLLGYDFEHIGEHIWRIKGIFEFWRGLPEALARA